MAFEMLPKIKWFHSFEKNGQAYLIGSNDKIAQSKNGYRNSDGWAVNLKIKIYADNHLSFKNTDKSHQWLFVHNKSPYKTLQNFFSCFCQLLHIIRSLYACKV